MNLSEGISEGAFCIGRLTESEKIVPHSKYSTKSVKCVISLEWFNVN